MRHRIAASGLLALVFSAQGAAAQNPPVLNDPSSIWTLQDENASISTNTDSDRYYVNGLRLGWTSGTDKVPDSFERLGQAVWGDGVQRISIDVSQSIFTPLATDVAVPPRGVRRYAGVLTANFALLHDTATARSMLGVSVGVLGPAAFGEQVQNNFHELIGQRKAAGWGSQINDQPVGELLAGRVWRLPITRIGALETDALPAVSGALGNLRSYAQAGMVLRIGQGLNSDFGVPRVLPGLSGGDAFVPTEPFAWYLFAGGNGQLVAQDLTITNNIGQTGNGLTIVPTVGEFEVGAALMAYGMRLTYTQVFQTQEFRHQKGGLHEFGSLALSVRF